MNAGLVAYKLCDRNFECQDCPLDAAMSGVGQSGSRRSRSGGSEMRVSNRGRYRGQPAELPPPTLWEYRLDRRYHPSHTWAKSRKTGSVFCGLDGFAAYLLEEVTGVILPVVGTLLWQGKIGGWIAAGRELIPIRSPVSGTVLRRNGRIQEQPELTVASPYDAGWLLEVSCDADPETAEGLLSAAEIESRTRRETQQLYEEIAGPLTQSDPDIGPTLPDGGEPVHDVRDLLGAKRYLNLIRSFLN
ncbi:MAG: hypothetical protein GY856_24900 [bacterium]|nr:hypothetical protein [bacterium]